MHQFSTADVKRATPVTCTNSVLRGTVTTKCVYLVVYNLKVAGDSSKRWERVKDGGDLKLVRL
jgi:hypothetical protein